MIQELVLDQVRAMIGGFIAKMSAEEKQDIKKTASDFYQKYANKIPEGTAIIFVRSGEDFHLHLIDASNIAPTNGATPTSIHLNSMIEGLIAELE